MGRTIYTLLLFICYCWSAICQHFQQNYWFDFFLLFVEEAFLISWSYADSSPRCLIIKLLIGRASPFCSQAVNHYKKTIKLWTWEIMMRRAAANNVLAIVYWRLRRIESFCMNPAMIKSLIDFSSGRGWVLLSLKWDLSGIRYFQAYSICVLLL